MKLKKLVNDLRKRLEGATSKFQSRAEQYAKEGNAHMAELYALGSATYADVSANLAGISHRVGIVDDIAKSNRKTFDEARESVSGFSKLSSKGTESRDDRIKKYLEEEIELLKARLNNETGC